VAEIYEMEVSDIFLIGKRQKRVTVQKKLHPLNEGGEPQQNTRILSGARCQEQGWHILRGFSI
jgi:hypothetical protein